MHDTRSILGGHIVARDYPESPFAGIHPGYELLVMESDEVFAFHGGDHFKRDEFRAFLVFVELEVGGLGVEHGVHKRHGHDHCLLLPAVRVVGADDVVFYLRPDSECRV